MIQTRFFILLTDLTILVEFDRRRRCRLCKRGATEGANAESDGDREYVAMAHAIMLLETYP